MLPAGQAALLESVAKQVLACYGIPVTREVLVANATEAIAAADRLGGPVALKVMSYQLPHKTEAGAIRLGVIGRESMRRQFDEMLAEVTRLVPDAAIEGVLVQEMVPARLELTCGMRRDPVFGPIVAVGLGGILIEMLSETAMLRPPFDFEEAGAAAAGLLGGRLVESGRGLTEAATGRRRRSDGQPGAAGAGERPSDGGRRQSRSGGGRLSPGRGRPDRPGLSARPIPVGNIKTNIVALRRTIRLVAGWLVQADSVLQIDRAKRSIACVAYKGRVPSTTTRSSSGRRGRQEPMHCGVMVTGYNQGDWDRLMAGDYDRPPDVPDYVHMDNTLHMGELVEPLGFDSIWATEHYGSAYSMQPNPLQWLAYWAGRTTRVDVGTAVIVAPWWNPVRLASEISMLDILLKGRRLHLGIGRGVAPHEYASLGIPIEESHTYFYDVVNAIRAADGAERFTFDGEVYKIPPTTIRPQARHKGELTTNIKAAFTTKKSAQLAAENGLGQMFVSGDDLDGMTAEGQAVQRDPGRARPAARPADDAAVDVLRRDPRRGRGGLGVLPQPADWRPSTTTSSGTIPASQGIKGYEEYLERQTADVGRRRRQPGRATAPTQPIGTPDEIIDKHQDVQQGRSASETLVIHVFYGGMPRDKAEKSLRLFAEKVLPAVQAMATPINPVLAG